MSSPTGRRHTGGAGSTSGASECLRAVGCDEIDGVGEVPDRHLDWMNMLPTPPATLR
jgi:hypothetical protein